MEGVFLRSKMYSFKTQDDKFSKKTAKGISKRAVRSHLNHQCYLRCLENDYNIQNVEQHRIISKNHNVFSVKQLKQGLSPFNDKIYMEKVGDEFVTHSFGHYAIRDKM